MPRGGSKPGERRGGRRKGVPNKATVKRQEEIQRTGVTPLDYMIQVLRDESQPVAIRLDAAGRAARYVHPSLAAKHEHSGPGGGSIPFRVESLSMSQLLKLSEQLADLLRNMGGDPDRV